VLGCGIRGLIVGKVLEHRSDPLLEQQTALGRQCALVTVNLCPYQGRERNVVKQFGERPLFQELFGLLDCLLRVIRQQTLVKGLIGCKNGIVAEHYIEKFELRHMTTENEEAHGQWRRQQQPDGPHSQVQKVAAAISATEDRPVLAA
jgi:hypothetical protein